MDARVVMLGDSAWLVEWPAGVGLGARVAEVHSMMRSLREAPDRPAGVLSVVAAFESLAVRYDPGAADGHAVRAWIERLLDQPGGDAGGGGELLEIPVCYGGDHGPDLDAVAEELGIKADEVVSIHSGMEYMVAMMGFAPGFPYLTGLPGRLWVPRLETPRNRVEAGAVAIAGEQAGIYPCASPGGWRVLGRTDVRLFDPLREDAPSLLMPGDRVRFAPVEGFDVMPPANAGFSSRGDIKVLEPGFATTVQDTGRPSHEHVGVSPGGALDREALRVANILVGNSADAAALELCVEGPVLRFEHDARVALVGADASGGLRHGRAVALPAGDVLETGALVGGLRAVLAVAGGIDVPQVMGSRATDVRAGFGGRVLRVGDHLPIGDAANPPSQVPCVSLARSCGRDLEIRFVEGPQAVWFAPESARRFEEAIFEVTTRQDRMGVRLHGERVDMAAPREMRSQPVASGSIQIPPDGRPMVLFAERQTHGGYPQIGCVITVDLPSLVRAMPGTRVHFRRVTLEDAWQARRDGVRHLQWLQAGLMCIT